MFLIAMIGKRIKPNLVTFNSKIDNKAGDDRILKMFEQHAAEKACDTMKDRRGQQDHHYISWLFQKMYELHIKPNVATFSSILNACR
ncbi:genomes uncoupled protein, putative [Medicago truncatula]|uniref:Genomes uncoupled protein, putative n=1 Tax=Medicago truncatula TaxID=3880 RepID=G7ZZ48_MEDTR|nr:genomes uncoupled protein, putative [Medicago truncatula]